MNRNLNTYKNDISNNYLDTNWLEISTLLSSCSKAIRNKNCNNINFTIIKLISIFLRIAKINDIDMLIAWNRWHEKALLKKYFNH